MNKVLIVDDEKAICLILEKLFTQMGLESVSVHTIQEGRKLLATVLFDIVLLDVQLPDGNGMDLLLEIHNQLSPPEVIIMTSAGNADGAELAIKSGAWDYIEKPFSRQIITLAVCRALEHRTIKLQSPPC